MSELDNKTMALETMNEKVTNKIKSELFQANERDYYLLNGNKNLSCASTCFVLNNNRENILEAKSL